MNYPEFRQAFIKELQKLLSEDVKAKLVDVERLNSTVRHGILFTKEGEKISPTIYLETYYSEYKNGELLDDLVEAVYDCYLNETKQSVPECIYRLGEFNFVKNNLFTKLIHYDENAILLQDTPHRRFLDFAIVVYYELEEEEGIQGTILIKKALLSAWKITEDELLDWAIQNTKDKKKTIVENIVNILESRLSEDEIIKYNNSANKMYVITNDRKTLGAICIYDEEVLEEVFHLFNDDYFLLPASIHEWIAVAANDVEDVHYLEWIVKAVNETDVSPEEILSNNVYLYRNSARKILVL